MLLKPIFSKLKNQQRNSVQFIWEEQSNNRKIRKLQVNSSSKSVGIQNEFLFFLVSTI